MRFRLVALQLWAAVSLAWLLACGVLAGSGWLEAQLGDAVRLQQQARDVRAAGMEPVQLVTGHAVEVGGFTVPPAWQEAADYWTREAAGWRRFALAPPTGLLLGMALLDALLEGLLAGVLLLVRGVRTRALRRRALEAWAQRRAALRSEALRARAMAFPSRAASFRACSTPLLAASSSD